VLPGASTKACSGCGVGFSIAARKVAHWHCTACEAAFCAPCVEASHPLLARADSVAAAALQIPPGAGESSVHPHANVVPRVCAGCGFSLLATARLSADQRAALLHAITAGFDGSATGATA
jgi:hypothetical protein